MVSNYKCVSRPQVLKAVPFMNTIGLSELICMLVQWHWQDTLFVDIGKNPPLFQQYVTSKLDTNNGLLCGSHNNQIAKLQLVQNAAAKVICGLRKFNRVTPSLYNLHWLPIEQRIIFKILLLVYKARSGEGPKYLKDLLLPYSAHHKGLTVQLRSSDPTLLDTPSTDKITYGDHSAMQALTTGTSCHKSFVNWIHCLVSRKN